MWFFLAVFSMFFVGISTILSKIGIKGADAYVVGAVTNALLLTAFGLCAWSGDAFGSVGEITAQTWLSVTASGIVLSVSWLFYFLGLKGGSISVFLAIQSFSVIFSMVLCRIFIKEEITVLMALGTALILTGIFLMIERGEISSLKGEKLRESDGSKRWIIYSFLSAVFSAVSYVIVKVDTAPLDTNLTSFFRYIIVNFALWGLILLKGKFPEFGKIKGKTWLFILFGGVASAVAHVLVYKALFFGKASVVITVYRMGMVISVILSKIVLKEKLSPRGWAGFAVLTAGVVTFALGR